ncbi:MAG TPA: type III pantothenate kinase [Pyrinomonadaceae bacterium]|jgi:type III pantothenate kinase|nr:type III pantothenate kinase [Pyrinomonadaceae bacterium]
MLLVIDAGNTNITLGVFEDDDLIVQWRIVTDHDKGSDAYALALRNLFESADIDLTKIHAAVIASVVPPLDQTLKRMVQQCFAVTPLFINHTVDTGLKILYDSPGDVGADRIVDAVAAVTKYGAPCIVVDFGTATTFNVINADREYLGGVIAPGIMISAEALFMRAAKLPRVEIKRPDKVIGSSTVRAMQSGLYHGYAGLVDGVLERVIAELGTKPHVIATGGLAPLIATASKFIEKVDGTLTLDGLRLVYERSKRV